LEESAEVGIGCPVEDDKAAVDGIGPVCPGNIDSVRMAAYIVVGLKNREVKILVKQMCADEA
jgi:hypothetical protein